MTNKNKVEAVLFASGRAMGIQQISDLTKLKPKQVKEAIDQLVRDYEMRETALAIFEQEGKWKVNVTEKYVPLVKKIVADTELDRPVLETLAVIAYRSPVLQSDIIKARGSGAYDHIKELVDKGFVTKEKYGRSYKLKISDKFFNYFDVAGDKDIREIFKGVKKPEVKILEKLGDLEVVPAESDEEHKKHREQMQLEIYAVKQSREDDKEFLKEFDERLDAVKDKVEKDLSEIERQKNNIPKKESQRDVEEGEHSEEELVDEIRKKEYDDPEELVSDVNKVINELSAGDKSVEHTESGEETEN